ncbi:MAG TPA: histidine kinase [Thermoanaerobaculia bacterium]
MKRRSLGRLLLIALGIVGAWLPLAVFNTSEHLGFAAATDWSEFWLNLFQYQLSSSLLWAVFTPFIIFIVERHPLRGSSWRRNLVLLIAMALGMAVVRAGVGGLVSEVTQGRDANWPFVLFSIQYRFVRNFFLVAFVVAILELIAAQRVAAERERDAMELRAEVARAELDGTRARLRPRFILSAMESISARIETQPAGADRLLIHYCDVLRRMLAADPRQDRTLGHELEAIEPYLALERTRTGGRFTTRFAVRADLLAARVPALLLLPLIEDALIRRAPDAPGHLEIRGTAARGVLRLEVEEHHATMPAENEAVCEVRARMMRTFGDEEVSVQQQLTPRGLLTALRMPLARANEGVFA